MPRISKRTVNKALDATAKRTKNADKRPKSGTTSDREIDVAFSKRPKAERELAKALPKSGLATKGRIDDAVRAIKDELDAADANRNGLSADEIANLSDPAQRAVKAATGKRVSVVDVRTAGADGAGQAAQRALAASIRGRFMNSGGGVEAPLKAFLSAEPATGTLGAERVRELLAPQWAELIQGTSGGGSDLADFQPLMADLPNLAAWKLPAADADALLTYLEDGDDPTVRNPPLAPMARALNRDLSDLVVVTFSERDTAGIAQDVGYHALFIGGRTRDGLLAGVFTSEFVE
jgi:hypothetical protein